MASRIEKGRQMPKFSMHWAPPQKHPTTLDFAKKVLARRTSSVHSIFFCSWSVLMSCCLFDACCRVRSYGCHAIWCDGAGHVVVLWSGVIVFCNVIWCIVISWSQFLLLQYHSVLQSVIPVNPALQKTIPVLPCTAGCHFCTTKSTVLQTTSPILNTLSYSKHYPTIQSPTLSPTYPTKFYPVVLVHQLIILKTVRQCK